MWFLNIKNYKVDMTTNKPTFFFLSIATTTVYYRGAMGILLVYDVTDERSFSSKWTGADHINNRNALPVVAAGKEWSKIRSINPSSNLFLFLYNSIDIRNWFSNIEQHASEGVNKILIGNKCDMPDKKVKDNSCFQVKIRKLPPSPDHESREGHEDSFYVFYRQAGRGGTTLSLSGVHQMDRRHTPY